jgi:hypothetical protein
VSAGTNKASDEFGLTDEEKKQLMEEAEELLSRSK